MGTGGLSLGIGPLCGENSGQHLYLPVQGARSFSPSWLQQIKSLGEVPKVCRSFKLDLKYEIQQKEVQIKSTNAKSTLNPKRRAGKSANPHTSKRSRFQPRIQVEYKSDPGCPLSFQCFQSLIQHNNTIICNTSGILEWPRLSFLFSMFSIFDTAQ